MPDTRIISQSVTEGDYSENPSGGVFFFAVSQWPYVQALPPTLKGLPFRESDKVTISTVDHEALWAGAVAIAITKISSLSWEVSGDIPLRTRRGHELLLNVDAGRGWVSFISKILQDFLLTNNGAFIEVVREGKSPASPIIGLIPLDSMRCTRTGDPEIPITYTDMKSRVHELQSHEVIEFADMPSNRASMFGSGICAAARAYKSIFKLAAIEDLVSEKVSGRNPSTLELIRGLNDPQLRSVLQTAQSEADARGAIAYMGAILATIMGEGPIDHASIPLKGMPENFDRKVELDIAVLSYANNLGLDPQDLQPLTGQALGTGAQSQVLAEKAKGKGLAAFRQQFTHALNEYVLPDLTTFEFVEQDWRDKKLKAEYNSAIEAYVSDSVKNYILTAPQGLQVLVDENVYDKALLPVDITPDDSLADIEKPEEGMGAVPVPAVTPSEIETPITVPEIKQGPPSSNVTINFPPGLINLSQPAPVVNVEAAETPIVNVTTPPVTVEAAQIQVNVPEQKQADIVVNVPTPIVYVDAPSVNVEAPTVNVAAPNVEVTNQVEPTPVTIENKITNKPPSEPIDLSIVRDQYGNITGIEEKQ